MNKVFKVENKVDKLQENEKKSVFQAVTFIFALRLQYRHFVKYPQAPQFDKWYFTLYSLGHFYLFYCSKIYHS